ncbi:MAG: hypothetical protein RMJ86_07725 [Anaerolineae bacterium]|nr:hypothetical protein [Thermoflexales bacterium]MCX7940129.1 hypothetical protein [Thermoflexales bacterium]MDW8054418.1 hypothetical protein [Anaerolineae bacterium]
MSELYERIRNARGSLESLISKLPGYKGYKEKEMRREADRLLREALVRDFTLHLDRLTALQNRALELLGVQWMSDFAEIKTALQTLIDRVRYAPQGYAGFFDAVRVKEETLEALEAFDRQLIEALPALGSALDAVENALSDAAQLKTALEKLQKLVSEAAQRFAQRSKVITGI